MGGRPLTFNSLFNQHWTVINVLSIILIVSLIKPCHGVDDEIYCPSLDIRNKGEGFAKLTNCTVIHGNLQFVLMESVGSEILQQLSFPKLREITGYLLFYRVFNLRTLENFFPNLVVIRGQELIHNYAFMVVDMPKLELIPMPSLRSIQRGYVMVASSPNVCYTQTVDWDRITQQPARNTFLHVTKACYQTESCDHCTEHYCWSDTICQKFDDLNVGEFCHYKCLGGCVNSSANGCNFCKGLSYNGECVDSCPDHILEDVDIQQCITEEYCRKRHKIPINGECLYDCPKGYSNYDGNNTYHRYDCFKCNGTCMKVCYGYDIRFSYQSLDLKGCTIINGQIIIELRQEHNETMKDLETGLGDIEEITGTLKIHKSPSLLNLFFFRNLRKIGGQTRKYSMERNALIIFENQNLANLFNFNEMDSFSINGSISIFNNAKLCQSELQTLKTMLQRSGNLLLTNNSLEEDILAKETNGFDAPCNGTHIFTTLIDITATNATLRWIYHTTPESRNDVQYFVIYGKTKRSDITISMATRSCEQTFESKMIIPNYVGPDTYEYTLDGLQALHRYAFFIHAETMTHNYNTMNLGFSTIKYFITKEQVPVPPVFYGLTSDSASITIMYRSGTTLPESIQYYILTVVEMAMNKGVETRNYCKDPFIPTTISRSQELRSFKRKMTDGGCGATIEEKIKRCNRYSKSLHEPKIYETDEQILRELLKFCTYDQLSAPCPMYDERDFQFSLEHWSPGKADDSPVKADNPPDKEDDPPESQSLPPLVQNFVHHVKIANTSDVYVIPKLKSSTKYHIFLRSCNWIACSRDVSIADKTTKKENIDFITELELQVDIKFGRILISFKPPKISNGKVLNYYIQILNITGEMKTSLETAFTNAEANTGNSEHKILFQYCIPQYDMTGSKYHYRTPDRYIPGRYGVRVQVVSLGGPERFSSPMEITMKAPIFDIPVTLDKYLYPIFSIILLMLVAWGVRTYYKKKKARQPRDDQDQLLPNEIEMEESLDRRLFQRLPTDHEARRDLSPEDNEELV